MSQTKDPQEKSIGDEIGAFKALFRPYERDYHTPGRDNSRHIERKPGVYVPSTVVNGGTAIQNNNTILQKAYQEAFEVAQAVESEGYDVIGVGKNHDNSLCVFTTGNGKRDSRERHKWDTEGTPFKSITIMGIPTKWWDHYERKPRLVFTDD